MPPFDYFRNRILRSAKWTMKREKLTRLETDENAKAVLFPELPTSKNDPLLRQIMEEYRPLHEDYVRAVSHPDIAISLEQAGLLAYLARHTPVRRVLDTGSGFSSLVLRLEALDKPGMQCVSVDDNRMWLEKTRDVLRAHAAPGENLLLWDDFAASRSLTGFDLIYHDMGGMTTRIFSLPEVAARLADNGLLILDDMHFDSYAPHIENSLLAGWSVSSMVKLTMDPEGRYAAIARRAPGQARPKMVFHGRYSCAENQSDYVYGKS
jgi:predicted O-methyltransferase YrrM